VSEAGDAARAEYCRDKATFCLATGVQPSEYDQLRDDEREAFIVAVNETGE
jgi:hypothetical protein